ncbi:MAG: HEAT repeat domain-containing protein, partial [Bacteroidales bacterium]
MKKIDINKIISDAESNNVDIARAAIFKIGRLGIVDAKPLLKELIYSKNQWIRDAAAISLGDLEAHEVVPEIMDLINNPNNKDNNGSLIYALRNLEVKDFFLGFIKLLTSDLESRDLALDIIENNLDKVSIDIQMQALIECKKDKKSISRGLLGGEMDDKKNIIQYIDYAISLLEGK